MKKIVVLVFGCFSLFTTAQVNSQKEKACLPVLLVNGFKDKDTIAVADLDKLSGLLIYDPCNKTVSKAIVSYIFTVFKGMATESIGGWGNDLTCKMKGALENVPAGSKIIFDVVQIKKPGGYKSIRGITLFVSSAKSSTSTEIDTVNQAKIPSCFPVLLMDSYHSGATITNEQLSQVKELSAYFSCNTPKTPNVCAVQVYYKISSYNLTVITNSKPLIFKSTSAEFPKEVKEWFRNLKVPVTLKLTAIKAKCLDGCVIDLPDSYLNITPASGEPSSGVNNFTRSPRKK